MYLRKIAFASAVAIMASTAAQACNISARVSVVGNEFPAIQSVGKGAQACKGAEVSTNLTADHQKINVAGMSGNPAEYTSAIIANSSIVALMNNDVIRPLDALVAKHGKSLKKNQLITIDGKVMAVAFMANAQHLVYREDVLKKINVFMPKSTSIEDMGSFASNKIKTNLLFYILLLTTILGIGTTFTDLNIDRATLGLALFLIPTFIIVYEHIRTKQLR